MAKSGRARKGMEDRFYVRQKNSVLSVSSRTALGTRRPPSVRVCICPGRSNGRGVKSTRLPELKARGGIILMHRAPTCGDAALRTVAAIGTVSCRDLPQTLYAIPETH
jgi:hypothetical protein